MSSDELYISRIEEGQTARQTVVVAFGGKMAAHLDCVADELLKEGPDSRLCAVFLIRPADQHRSGNQRCKVKGIVE